MRVGFAGTPEFAARALAAINASGYTIPLVVTQPDRPSGRGMAVMQSPVKRFAIAHALDLRQPATLRSAEAQRQLKGIEIDVLVVAAYGLILPQPVLDWPRRGCFNIHASLLPRWRGAAPIARAIEAGDTATGITIMQMDAGLDTGPMLAFERVPIGDRDTAGTLHERLADVGARLIVDTLRTLANGEVAATPQPVEGVTYAAKIERGERPIDWRLTAVAIDRKIRALSPSPGATASWRGSPVRVVAAIPVAARSSEGTGTVVAVTAAGVDVACGEHTVLRFMQLQPAGGRAMPAAAFAAGRALAPGARFDAAG